MPEIRDYDQINKELTRILGEGAKHVVLAGVEGQRLLASRLRGEWSAVIEVEGHAGPELAAGMDAPGLRVVIKGDVADGAGSGLNAGLLVISGNAGDCLGYGQRGGSILVGGSAGHRAGLLQRGGHLVVLGQLGRLAGERQSGGWLVTVESHSSPFLGHGRRGGRHSTIGPDGFESGEDRAALSHLARVWSLYLPEPGPYLH